MDSLFSFAPIWKHPDVLSYPDEDIETLRIRSLNRFLKTHKREFPTSLGLPVFSAVVDESFSIIQAMLEDSSDQNPILKRIRNFASFKKVGAMEIFSSSLAMWYSSAAPAISRDSLQGLNPASLRAVDENGEEYEPWSRGWAEKQHASANLGILAILMTTDEWFPPVHPLLKAGCVVSRSVTVLIYAAFLIVSTSKSALINEEDSDSNEVDSPNQIDNPGQAQDANQVEGANEVADLWNEIPSTKIIPAREAIEFFLRSAWSLTREKFEEREHHPPGIEFGTTLSEVGLSHDGSQLLTSVGRAGRWAVPPPWHPVRRVPGTAWNKILRNQMQPVFSELPSDSTAFHLTVPGSCGTLVQPYEKYYFELRNRMDQTGRPRRMISHEAGEKQFRVLSKKTGRPYPSMELSEDNASFTDEPEQEWLYKLPMIKRPITDMRGNMSFPFLTSLARAWRFQREIDEVEPDFHIMSFLRPDEEDF
ncbi:hypothetical protein CP532_0635 [Ophiocordyceps camponoti-leonardi (nom. inval.)]|nr:hypothetical protein CP532_0635 [Ophiocordyceps camponoti-leonardi (nom. inval.)]